MIEIGFRVNRGPAHSFPAHHFIRTPLIWRRGAPCRISKGSHHKTGRKFDFCATPAGPGLPARAPNLSAGGTTLAWAAPVGPE